MLSCLAHKCQAGKNLKHLFQLQLNYYQILLNIKYDVCNGQHAVWQVPSISIDSTPTEFVDECKYLRFTLTKAICIRISVHEPIRPLGISCTSESSPIHSVDFTLIFHGILSCLKASTSQHNNIKACYESCSIKTQSGYFAS